MAYTMFVCYFLTILSVFMVSGNAADQDGYEATIHDLERKFNEIDRKYIEMENLVKLQDMKIKNLEMSHVSTSGIKEKHFQDIMKQNSMNLFFSFCCGQLFLNYHVLRKKLLNYYYYYYLFSCTGTVGVYTQLFQMTPLLDSLPV